MPLMIKLWNYFLVSEAPMTLSVTRRTVVKPPFGELLVTANKNKSQVFISNIASQNCGILKCLFSMPVLFDLTLLMAKARSCSVKNFAFKGEPGRKKRRTTPQPIVMAPQMRKINLQLSRYEWM